MSSRDALTNAPPALSAAGPDTLLSRAFVLVWLYSALTTMAWGTLLPVVPLYVRGPLDGGDIAVGAVMSAAVLVAALAQPLLGRAADRRGRRVLLVGGPLTFSAFVLLFTIVDSPTQLFGLRTAAEIGEAAFVIGAITVVNDLAPDDRRGEAYNIYSLSTWAGVGLGWDWRLRPPSKLVHRCVGVVSGALSLAGAAVAVLLPETRRRTREPVSRSGMFSRSVIVPGAFSRSRCSRSQQSSSSPSSLYARESSVWPEPAWFSSRMPLSSYRSASSAGDCPTAWACDERRRSASSSPSPAQRCRRSTHTPSACTLEPRHSGSGTPSSTPRSSCSPLDGLPRTKRSAALGSLKAFEAIGFAAAAALLGVTASLVGYRGAFGPRGRRHIAWIRTH